jgi:predicted N-acetyltransferase YhbS
MIIKPPTREEIPQLRQLWKQAFGDTDAFLDIFFSAAFSPERCRCVVTDGEVAAALYWFSCEAGGQPLAYLYAVATAKQFRGKGFCRRLMADTHNHLEKLGYAGAILVPGDPGLREMYHAMGYRDMTANKKISCKAGKAKFLEEIGAEQYAVLRRKLLPANSVVQEGENLRFLEGFAQFYRGGDCLLCAVKDGSKLTVPELLGNAAAAPGIVAALGCEDGTYTVPGENEPFAMCIAFAPDFQQPRYFAFAFD